MTQSPLIRPAAVSGRAGLHRRTLLTSTAALGASLLLPRGAAAQLRIDITSGTVQPLPVALPDFIGGSGADGEVGRNVTQIITSNLRRSGLFAPIDPAAYLEKIVNIDSVP